MKRLILSIIILGVAMLSARSADPTATSFSTDQCRGTYALYSSDLGLSTYPDSLTPVMVNYLGRHGSRYPSSPRSIERLLEALEHSREAGTLTSTGKELLELAHRVVAKVAGQWGAVDSLGMAEERGIASRMVRSYPTLFKNSSVEAYSSFAPRCIMSMYSFTHQIARLDNTVEISTSSGRRYSYLLRPFDVDAEYREYRQQEGWQNALNAFQLIDVTLEPLKRALGDLAGYSDPDARELALDEYKLVAGAAAAGVPCNSSRFFELDEYNRLWQAENMRMYLLYSSNTVSTIPSDMMSPLLLDFITTTQAVVDGEAGVPTVVLRFGHAETIIPFLSLLRLKGCYYMTNYFDTVALHWQDFHMAPMAANVRFVLFKSKKGRYYVKVELNEQAVPLMPGSDVIYLPWETARGYMERCIPIFYQP